MKRTIPLGIVVGSLRKGSYSRSIAQALADFLPEEFACTFLSMGDLPLYNQDLDEESKTPPQWTAFRQEVAKQDAFLFVTPENNRSLPPVLKNALDIASRPYGQNKWSGKPAAVISVSPGRPGGFGANHHLRQCLVFLNVFAMQQPEAYISNVNEALDENGKVTDPSVKKLLQQVAEAFVHWVEHFQ